MKLLSLLLCFIPFFSFAQEFTQPDSAAVMHAHVKSVKVYYTGTGSEHYLTREMRYDKNGYKIFEREGNAGYYYASSYNEKGWLISSIQRKNDGSLIRGYLNDYYENGKVCHTKVISEKDSVRPEIVYTYDIRGNKTGENYFTGSKLTFSKTIYYDSAGRVSGYKDSIPGNHTGIHDKQHLLMENLYDSAGRWRETWKFEYDQQGKIAKVTQKKLMQMDNIFTFENGGLDKMKMNHIPASQKKKEEFKSKWGILFPPNVREEEYGLPYSDPVPEYEYKHDLTRDKKGNIIKDTLSPAYEYMKKETIVFDYEYEYW